MNNIQGDHGGLDFVDLNSGVPGVGPFAMPSLPNFPLPKQNWAARRTNQLYQNQWNLVSNHNSRPVARRYNSKSPCLRCFAITEIYLKILPAWQTSVPHHQSNSHFSPGRQSESRSQSPSPCTHVPSQILFALAKARRRERTISVFMAVVFYPVSPEDGIFLSEGGGAEIVPFISERVDDIERKQVELHCSLVSIFWHALSGCFDGKIFGVYWKGKKYFLIFALVTRLFVSFPHFCISIERYWETIDWHR